MTISELTEDRVVEGVFAVESKRKLRTKCGRAVPRRSSSSIPTGTIEARVWKDVELLDGRFGEGDAVRVLGRVEKFRDRLQLDVRTLEAADVDPASLTPALRRDAEELAGLPRVPHRRVTHPGLAGRCGRCSPTASSRPTPPPPTSHHSYAGGLLEHTVGVATLCRETAQLHPRLRSDLLLAAALVHDVGRTIELQRGPAFAATDEGRLLGHVHLGLRLIEERAEGLTAGQLAELLHCVAVHHDLRGARTAEAAVLYHANQLDAIAQTRRVD